MLKDFERRSNVSSENCESEQCTFEPMHLSNQVDGRVIFCAYRRLRASARRREEEGRAGDRTELRGVEDIAGRCARSVGELGKKRETPT